jgi:hypothetical protein
VSVDLEALKAAARAAERYKTKTSWAFYAGDVLELIARIEQAEAHVGIEAMRVSVNIARRRDELEAALVREQENADRLFDHLNGLCADRDHDHTEQPCTGCIESLVAHAGCVEARPTSTETPVVAPHSPANTRRAP